MIVKGQPGARLGLNDPLCHVKSDEELTSKTGQLLKCGNQKILLNHCDDLDPRIPQADDGVDRSLLPQVTTGKRGPVITTEH